MNYELTCLVTFSNFKGILMKKTSQTAELPLRTSVKNSCRLTQLRTERDMYINFVI